MQLSIKSYVTGGYQDVEDYIYNLVQRLSFFGPLTMQVDMTVIGAKDLSGDRIKDNNEAKELMDYFQRFITESLEVIDDNTINDPNNFWFSLRLNEIEYADYLSSAENSEFDKIRYILTIKKIN